MFSLWLTRITSLSVMISMTFSYCFRNLFWKDTVGVVCTHNFLLSCSLMMFSRNTDISSFAHKNVSFLIQVHLSFSAVHSFGGADLEDNCGQLLCTAKLPPSSQEKHYVREQERCIYLSAPLTYWIFLFSWMVGCQQSNSWYASWCNCRLARNCR